MTRILLTVAFALGSIGCIDLNIDLGEEQDNSEWQSSYDRDYDEDDDGSSDHDDRDDDDRDDDDDDQGQDDEQNDKDNDQACEQAEYCWDTWEDQAEACGDWVEQAGDCLYEMGGIEVYCDEIYAGLPYGQYDADDVEDCESQRAEMQGQLDEAEAYIDQFCGEADALEIECEELDEECAG